MSKFIILNKRNGGCPVCNSSDGRCRTTEDERGELILCMDSHGDVPGFYYLGESHGGLWGKYKFDDGKERERREYEPTPEPQGVKLPAPERDAAIRSIIQQLPLHDIDRDDITRRKLTPQQMNDWGFYSLSKDSVLETPVNPDLAGMAIDGRHFCIKPTDAGYGIPIKDIYGDYVGSQLRIRKVKDGNRYKWLKSRKNHRRERDAVSHTAEFNELPLQHAIVNPSQGLPLFLTEGMGKPVYTSFRFDLNVIGASGGNFLSSIKTLKNSLDILKPSVVILGADAGSRVNKNVLRNYRRLALILKEWGYDLLVADWGQGSDKSKPDIDELDAPEWELKPYDNWDVAFRIPANQILEIDHISDWKTKQIYGSHLAWKNHKRYTADTTYDEPFCTSPQAPKKDEIVAICYHTSQGKSTKIKKWFKEELKDLGADKFGSRNSLEIQFAASSDFYHLREDDGHHLIKDPRGRLTLCIDSILKYEDEDFDGKVIVLDEIVSLIEHVLSGGTLKERQQQVIDKLKVALQRCHSVICADGNLTDSICEYIRQVSGKQIIKYYNKRLPKRPVAYVYDHVGSDYKKIMHQMMSETFFWGMFDTQIDCEAADKDLVRYGRKPLRIDSKTINDPIQGKEVKRFLSDPDGFLIENEEAKTYDCILSSPTVESGLDCNYKGFSGVYVFAKHLGVDKLTQIIIRVRDITVPRHICCAKFVKNTDDDSTIQSPIAKTIDRFYKDFINESINASEIESTAIAALLKKQIDIAIAQPEHRLFMEHQAVRNYERANLRDCFIESLQDSGYEIVIVEPPKQIVLTQFKECKKEVKQEKAKDVCDAQKIDEKQYKALSKRQDLKWEDRCSVIKYKLLERLPGIEAVWGWDKDFVYHLLFENKKLINQAEIRWMLDHPELAVKRSEKAWHGVLKHNRTFLGNFKSLLPLIKELKRLDVPKLLEKLSRIYYNSDTPEVKQLWEGWGRVQVARTGVERGNSPARLINRLAAKLGYESEEVALRKVNGKTTKDFILFDLLDDTYGLIVSHCVDERLTDENLEPRLTDDDWMEILQRETRETRETSQSNTSSGYDLTYSYINTNRLNRNRYNPHTEDITAIPVVKNTQQTEPEPEPTKMTQAEPKTEPTKTQSELPKVGTKIECFTAGGWKPKTVKKAVGGKMPNVQFTDGSFYWLFELSDRSRFKTTILTDFSQGVNIREDFTG
ncbi:MAG: plasmid replication protein, CyRepA1 family [Planktothrix sp.]|uniref:plasmid replication protein, CyRepA1 family n=1 Tax=Planktothrix sp. TaxID=3088171 RepID=UPI0038D49F52